MSSPTPTKARSGWVGPYARFSGTPLPHAPPSPALGQHTAEILEWLGYTQEEVERLRESKTLI